MSNGGENVKPRLIIVNHFDDFINKIDVKTESLLETIEINKNNKISEKKIEEKRNELNEIRDKQIEKIKEIEQINLNHLSAKEEEEYEEKWSHILEDNSLNYQQKIDQIKENLIRFDCVLLEQPEENNGNGLDLWITSWFYNQKSLEFLK